MSTQALYDFDGTTEEFTFGGIQNKEILEIENVDGDMIVTYIYFTDFRKADLENSNFSGSHLGFALFNDANLVNTDFSGANLYGADFTGANLEGANLECINHEICR